MNDKPEFAQIWFVCKHCEKRNFPFGEREVSLPRTEKHVCEFCGKSELYTWLDSVSKFELARKNCGLSPQPDSDVTETIHKLEERMAQLEERDSRRKLELDTLNQQLILEQNARSIHEKEIAKLRAFQERYEKDILTLETLIEVKEIQKEQKEKFQVDNR